MRTFCSIVWDFYTSYVFSSCVSVAGKRSFSQGSTCLCCGGQPRLRIWGAIQGEDYPFTCRGGETKYIAKSNGFMQHSFSFSLSPGLPSERSVLHWPGHLGVAWDVSLVSMFSDVNIRSHQWPPTHLLPSNLPFNFLRSVPQQGPVGRSWHSFTPVSPDHIFLFGGFTTVRETLS